MCYWFKFSENVIRDFKDEVYTFSHIAELNTITVVKKMDMSYAFYIKHNMYAVEWKLFSMINKDKNSINKFNCNKWRHPLIRKYSHVPFIK